MFSQFFEAESIAAIKDEGRKAKAELDVMLTRIIKKEERVGPLLGKFLVGDYDRDDPHASARWLARFTMSSALMASVSLMKGENPDSDGVFCGVYEYRVAFAAHDVLRAARALASPIRAEYAVQGGIYSGENDA
jgi:hypothetical protein